MRRISQALLQNKPEGGASADLLDHINAEANVLTALICHADSLKPKSVCSRPTMRQLLRYVK